MVKFLATGQGYFCFDVFESTSTSIESDPFIKLFYQQFHSAMQHSSKRKRTMLLTTLMNRLEDHYKLSMIKERFERETHPEVKKIYLAAAAARKM